MTVMFHITWQQKLAEPRLVYCKGIDCVSDVVRYSILVVIHLDI